MKSHNISPVGKNCTVCVCVCVLKWKKAPGKWQVRHATIASTMIKKLQNRNGPVSLADHCHPDRIKMCTCLSACTCQASTACTCQASTACTCQASTACTCQASTACTCQASTACTCQASKSRVLGASCTISPCMVVSSEPFSISSKQALHSVFFFSFRFGEHGWIFCRYVCFLYVCCFCRSSWYMFESHKVCRNEEFRSSIKKKKIQLCWCALPLLECSAHWHTWLC